MMPRLTLLGLLRSAGVVIAALFVATVLPRYGVPVGYLPDLVLLLVVASAVLRGSVHGALLGLAAGWVVDLVPPGGSPLGLTALMFAAAGAVAGGFHRARTRGVVLPLVALASARAVVELGTVCVAILQDGRVDPANAAAHVLATVLVGLVALPVVMGVDRALTRRRLA